MNPQKPGWQSTEFWITSLTQLVALLAALGWVSVGDKETLGGAIANGVTAAFALIASAAVIVRYIAARLDLKSQSLKTPDVGSRPTLPVLFLALGLWLLAGSVSQAQQPAAAPVVKTSLFGWREAIQIEQLKGRMEMQQQAAQQQNAALQAQLAAMQASLTAALNRPAPAPAAAPAQPQVLILAIPQQGPQQHLPIAGPPQQVLPIAGAPQQQLPIAGAPQQQLPIQGAPQQQMPQAGPPVQQLPIGSAPQQQLAPPGQARPQGLPPIGEARPQPLPQSMPPADPLPQNGAPRQQLLPTGQPQRYMPAVARR